MQYRKYGKTDFEVSALGMGCMRLPRTTDKNGNVSIDKEKAIELVQYAADHGINYFDTALTYHNRESETLLGEALDGERRKRVKIATKQPLGVVKKTSDIRRNLEATLKKLRTDHIDMYLLHNIQPGLWDGFKQIGFLEEYEKFKQEGLIKNIAFSYHGDFSHFSEIVQEYPWAMCQVQQNILDSDREVTVEAFNLAEKLGIAMVIMEPLRGGGLACTPTPVRELYDQHPIRRPAYEWAFRYLLDFPATSCVLSGMTTLEQLKENIALFSQPDTAPGNLSSQDKLLLANVKKAYESIVTVPCTSCEYCIPCPKNVNIPRIFSLYNQGMMFGNFNQPQRGYMFARNSGETAANCVQCGICEPKCPQKIQIMEKLQVAHAALDGWYE